MWCSTSVVCLWFVICTETVRSNTYTISIICLSIWVWCLKRSCIYRLSEVLQPNKCAYWFNRFHFILSCQSWKDPTPHLQLPPRINTKRIIFLLHVWLYDESRCNLNVKSFTKRRKRDSPGLLHCDSCGVQSTSVNKYWSFPTASVL